jgi:predicted Fe-Mo cluster-binding NifX family protein
MKIIIPVVGRNGSIKSIAQSFHNTEQACIYNCTNKTYEWVSTKSISVKSVDLAEELRNIGISAVISTQMPLMALGFFTESGLSVYQATSESIEENIRLFAANQLKPLTNALAKSSASCTGSCSACSTSCNS